MSRDDTASSEEGHTPERPDPQGDAREGGILRLMIERPVTVMVGIILVVFFGAAAIVGLPIQLTPDITVPTISVRTSWPGASPVEVESDVIQEQEEVLKNVQGLTRMEAQASLNEGQVTLEFEVGTDLDEALVRVSNALSQVPSYPENVNQPVISTADSTGPPLAVIIIRSKNNGEPVAAYRTWVDQQILPQLERIKGVASVRHIGGRDREVHIDFDPIELAARGLTVAGAAQAVRGELRDLSGGDMTLSKRRLLVRTIVAPPEPAFFERVVVGAGVDGAPVQLGDVASVRQGLRKPNSIAFTNDTPSMALLLNREAGTNVLEVTEKIKDSVARMQREDFDAEGLEIEVVSDQSGYINGALDLVQQNLLLGATLAVLVLLIFLRSFGASVIISVSIPVCVFGTALGMTLFGRTVNVVSLAGVTFAIGMVVDNSIVALENIDTWRGRVSDPKEAAYKGVKEVWGALLSSTLTTAAVFIPIVLWQGEVGELLRDVAYAIAIAVLISLVVSVLVIPSLCARFLKTRVDEDGESEQQEVQKPTGAFGKALAFARDFRGGIAGIVRWLSASTWRSLGVVLLALGVSLGAAWTLLPKLEYLPTGSRNLIFGIILPPPGVAVEELDEVGQDFTSKIASHVGTRKDGVPPIARSFFVGAPDRLFSGVVAEKTEEIPGVLKYFRSELSQIPGMISFAVQASLFGGSIGGGRSIELEISGRELEEVIPLAQRMFGMSKQALKGAQIRPIPSLDAGAPELHILPRRKEAANLGISGPELGTIVDAYVDGTIIGEYGREGETKVDVVMRAAHPITGEESILTPDQLRSAPVALPNGEVVPFEVLADITQDLGPIVVRRIERRRAITLQITPPEEIALEEAIEIIETQVVDELIRQNAIPPEVGIDIAGTAGKLKDARGRFIWILAVAFLISFLLLSALFEDFLAPVAVLITVPLAAAGGLASLRAVDAFLAPQPLDLMTALGFLILIGVVVNNAILVVDGALAYMRDGTPLEDAVPEAVRARVRPIFMSTMTSLAGLAPMVLISGSGSELYRGVGAIVLGGLGVSAILTLFVVPSLFTFLWRMRRGVASVVSSEG